MKKLSATRQDLIKRYTGLPLGLLLGAVVLSAAIRYDPGNPLVQRLSRYVANYWQEKVYLHFDKPYYSTGDTIWFQAYLMNAVTHQPGGRSELLHVELISPDNQVIAQRALAVAEGGAPGDIDLSDSLPSGNYRIRAYTNWMRNFSGDYFFSKTFPVWSTDSTAIGQVVQRESQVVDENFVYEDQRSLIDLQFFPEGGDLIDGLATLVAFKAVGPDGKSIPVSGTVVDQARQVVATFDTHHQGMGGFIMKPAYGEAYTAQVLLQGVNLEFPLPEVLKQGYALRVRHASHQEKVKVTVRANQALAVAGGTLVAHQRGVAFAAVEVQGNPPYLFAEIDRPSFPAGICHLTFFDSAREPRCERLLFIHPPTLSTVTVAPDAFSYATRSRVEVQMTLQNSDRQAVAGQASLTVTDPKNVRYAPYTDDIYSYLFLTSDLRGVIEQPNYYLQDTSLEAYRARDLLMLTQGWRRFRWEEVLSDSVPELPYLVEHGFNISGRLVKFYNREKPASGTIAMMIMDQAFAYTEGDTDTNGRFVFVENHFEDSTEVVLQARRKVGKKDRLRKDVAILLDAPLPPPFSTQIRPRMTPTLALMNDYLEQRRRIEKIDEAYNFDEKTIVLEGVEVKGRKDERNDPFYRASQIYNQPSNRLVLDSIPGASSALSIFDLIQRVPGVRVVGSFPNQTAIVRGITSFRGGNEALFLLDGIPGDAALANSVNANDVHYIDVLKGPSAAIYGSRGSGGVIAIYTRRGSGITVNEDRQGIINFTHPGYSEVREFYTPRYDIKKPEHVKPDVRSTLFWEPTISIDENGRASLAFYTSDQTGTYDLRLEGVTAQGEPVVGTASFTVR